MTMYPKPPGTPLMETQAQRELADATNQAWTEEIDRRVARLESGESMALPVEEVWPAIAGKPWRAASSDNV